MTREQLKAILPEGTEDSVVTKLLDAMHAEIQPYKDAAKQAADDLAAKVNEMAEVSKTAATAGEKAKAYDELQAKYDADLKAANERAADLEFHSKLDDKLRAKGARSPKAAKAFLDLDALKASKNQDADMDAAIDALTKGEESSCIFEAQKVGKIDVGKSTGNPAGAMTRADIDKMTDPFARQAAIAKNINLYRKG